MKKEYIAVFKKQIHSGNLTMEDKRALIKSTIRDLLRISAMYGQIEAMPIRIDSKTEVSTREAHTIQAVGENQDMNVTQLAEHFGITKSGASQMVKKLVNKDFILKRQSAHSNKEFELSLTPMGWQVFKAHERIHGEDLNKLINGLTSFSISQIATLSVLLESFREIMESRISKRGNKAQ